MILQALYQLAEREDLLPDPDYQDVGVSWLVRVGTDGKLIGIEGTHTVPEPEGRRRPRPVPKKLRVPRRQTSRSGTRPPADFLVDNALYVFGISVDGKYGQDKCRQRAEAFRQSVRQCYEATGDEAVGAVLAFLDSVASGTHTVDLETLDPPVKSNDLFAFAYADEDRLVTDRPKVEAYWRSLRRAAATEAADWICLVTGEPCAPVHKHRKIKHVPQKGGAGDIALIPLGSPSNMFESYGWKKNENAPISEHAAEMCATALNRLLDPNYPDPHQPGQTMPRRSVRVSDDTVVCYWSARASGDEFCSALGDLLEGNPEQVRNLYRSIRRGVEADIQDPSAFYALTLTGQQGRIIVRDWLESTVAEAARNLAAHFRDLAVVRNAGRQEGRDEAPLSLRTLMEATADPAERRGEGVPAHLAAQFVRAALAGTPYPLVLLQRAVLRYRAEIGSAQQDETLQAWRVRNWNDARAALIKAVLNRRMRFHISTLSKEVTYAMDPTNREPGYLLGQLMAVFERLQQLAVGDPNASVVDRYFSGASAAPKSVFVRLYKNALHHARKARDTGQGGLAFRLERLVDELSAGFGLKPRALYAHQNALPAYLNQEQQALFVLGYHHMRRWLWMTVEEHAAWEAEHPDAPRAYLWGHTEQTSEPEPQTL